ncbi:low temperature requirement protein A [Dryocola sp. LX212]
MKYELLRVRNGKVASVSFAELLFDLIYVFAVTQISHYLLNHLTVNGFVESLVLWFAVWLAWQYTAWITNWFDPEARPVRLMLFVLMLLGLYVAAAIPSAFGERGLIFALFFVAIQVGRTCATLFFIESSSPLRMNFLRILGWLCISAAFWIAGGFNQGNARLLFWFIAVLCEYISPMLGYHLPFLGRSKSETDWTIEGHHLAERCQLFVIVALGETLLITGSSLSRLAVWQPPTIIASIVSFIGCLAMWWIYFDKTSKAASLAIRQSSNPGKMGAYFHYVHVALVGSIIVYAVGNELTIAHPDEHITRVTNAVLIFAPALYLLSSSFFKKIVYGRFPASHIGGLLALLVLAVIANITDLLMVNTCVSVILIYVAIWEVITS